MTASSDARVRFSPAFRLAGHDFGSSQVSIRRFCALASNPPYATAQIVERRLAVVPERRMADVMGEAGQVDQVRVAAQPDRHSATDLRDLERMRQPGPRRVAFPRPHDLGLAGEPPERGAVQHPRPVAGEIGAMLGGRARQRGCLRRLDHHPLAVVRVIGLLIRGHRGSVCQHVPPSRRIALH